ncbi:MAG: nitrogenase component 1 [Lachnospiraceae bacterium]|nr:nitrogenase component 1 [Lachnospiraceae bacterium]
MKGLLKYLSPFAPDQSGAQAVLYDLGGIIVISDAGGCTGNICGFDEPRWFGKKSRIFSAGLRDMDAILGRDDRLVEKLALALRQVGGKFAAVIGTPVPAVTATDYRALKSLATGKTRMTVIAVECKGTALYDEGAKSAWEEVFTTFSGKNPAERVKAEDDDENSTEKVKVEYDDENSTKEVKAEVADRKKIIGIIGMTPLDISLIDPTDFVAKIKNETKADEVYAYGMGAGTEEIEHAGEAELNLVVSPAGLSAARYLKKKYGTEFETGFPFFSEDEKSNFRKAAGKRVLVVHQQMAGNEIRKIIEETDGTTDVTCGTWFMSDSEYARKGDVRFETEEGFRDYVLGGSFDVIIGDPLFKRALKEFKGTYIEACHYAVSGYDQIAE